LTFGNETFDAETVALMRRIVADTCAQYQRRYIDVAPNELRVLREAIATAVLSYARLGVRDPLILRAMALAVIRPVVEA
jgi:hypothetical protein